MKKVMKIIGILSLISQNNLYAKDQNDIWITIDPDATDALVEIQAETVQWLSNSSYLVAKINNDDRETLSKIMHEKHHRCGGFIAHNHFISIINNFMHEKQPALFHAPEEMKQQDIIANGLTRLSSDNIKMHIEEISSEKTRYHRSKTGKQFPPKLLHKFRQYGENYENLPIKYSTITHQATPQESVMVHIKGKTQPNKYIVIGAHLDSINVYNTQQDAPGADDDASGLAVILEIFKQFIDDGQPDKSVIFFGYAAEEVGLVGSSEIARLAQMKDIDIEGVLQFDMTNHPNGNKDIYFVTDYTNHEMTKYLQSLLDYYMPHIKHSTTQCGYACSDHASWYFEGFPSAMPFESDFTSYNQNIHTRYDTLENSDSTAKHALNFASLGYLFTTEMARN